ncbi:hypothetical protein [Planktotalea sp.]|uniref:hypothetical protein n=1 Tax=Planktotalea sp. TaxID=2029877 RepID=UPI0025E89F35|nr:hypothetical protein [Planktotalea sp.]
MTQLAATLFAFIIATTILFQICLIAGAPWGRFTQGGQHAGKLPIGNRFAAGVSILLLLAMAAAMLSAAGYWPNWPIWTGWALLVLQILSTTLNWITPSKQERRIWGPVTTVMLILVMFA